MLTSVTILYRLKAVFLPYSYVLPSPAEKQSASNAIHLSPPLQIEAHHTATAPPSPSSPSSSSPPSSSPSPPLTAFLPLPQAASPRSSSSSPPSSDPSSPSSSGNSSSATTLPAPHYFAMRDYQTSVLSSDADYNLSVPEFYSSIFSVHRDAYSSCYLAEGSSPSSYSNSYLASADAEKWHKMWQSLRKVCYTRLTLFPPVYLCHIILTLHFFKDKSKLDYC